MNAYNDLCSAFLDAEPRSQIVHELVQGLPNKMVTALRRYLELPPVYVQLCSSLIGEGRPLQACKDDEPILLHDEFGRQCFSIAVMIAPPQGEQSDGRWAITSRFMFFSLCIDEIEPDYLLLNIRNSGHALRVNNPRGDDDAYIKASVALIKCLVEHLRESGSYKGPVRIGFLPIGEDN